MANGTHTLEVWGDLACFTRPEMKVERFSYPVITPSAARGIFDAIYWDARREGDRVRPYFFWQVTRIEVLELPRFIALRRNEVKDRVPGTAILNKWMKGTATPEPLWADGSDGDQKGRTQRQTMALKHVRYRLTARIVPKSAFRTDQNAMNSQFQRRARAGKCFQQPYFGCREFPAFFEYVEDPGAATQPPVALDQHLGLMLYDIFDLNREAVKDGDPSYISLFDATLHSGVLEVPPFDSPAVKKPGGA
ncbi:type I-C CRISPR-associated protein Cas5c [uncultured Thiodictyon sp.]|uniref:type I-C CRISPR-associated protein Cas5c n=1 Tax=uncultured Thiodictyon sp. TaxID=1846217 RepID=UPI0025CE4B55|nr:type I-C CRISPR-associated protein Cas5c [uncultured Thiodictyon sp.]